ncbi:MAG: hypothetical protein QM742_09595 [Aquabacterium sp.]
MHDLAQGHVDMVAAGPQGLGDGFEAGGVAERTAELPGHQKARHGGVSP